MAGTAFFVAVRHGEVISNKDATVFKLSADGITKIPPLAVVADDKLLAPGFAPVGTHDTADAGWHAPARKNHQNAAVAEQDRPGRSVLETSPMRILPAFPACSNNGRCPAPCPATISRGRQTDRIFQTLDGFILRVDIKHVTVEYTVRHQKQGGVIEVTASRPACHRFASERPGNPLVGALVNRRLAAARWLRS